MTTLAAGAIGAIAGALIGWGLGSLPYPAWLKGWKRIALVLVLMVIAGVAAMALAPPSEGATPFEIDKPRNGQISYCPEISGTGRVEKGQQIWLAQRAENNKDFWMKAAEINEETGKWYVRGEVGSKDDVNVTFYMRAFVVDAEWSSWLHTTKNTKDYQLNKKFLSEEFPPHVAKTGEVAVTRNEDVQDCKR
ncbi:hypothetical protein Aph01nite_59370 [Acrocarpospora phusangensis]|uniref:Uncharacterized protein n=1 Tax=Acrocarpospora phusangensis TaxID=1070424 RepID=A0A919QK24_9ACTN|nr:hypothetical protein [Acrocarpospora phusangensis]GIH27627.1 hypothetical protein Aph01nite_59370 [Acrocarpospora phusangensis]